MYLPIFTAFLLLMGIIVISFQNSMPLELKFFIWNLHLSSTALILYSSLIGGAIFAVLSLPKLARKALDIKKLNKEIYKLKRKILELEKGHSGSPQQ